MIYVAVLIVLAFDFTGAAYPECLLKHGECLDNNQGPLLEYKKPQINTNVINETIFDVESVEDCASLCFNNDECGFFTYYRDQLPENMREKCGLVGFNLRKACFNLEKACVLLQHCEEFDTNCTTCQSGKRPFMDPKEEPLTLVVSGVVDDREFQKKGIEQYSDENAAFNELIMDMDDKSCPMINARMTRRHGAAGSWAKDMAIVCGGYSLKTKSYLKTCEYFEKSNMPWESTGDLNEARAFATSFYIPEGDLEGMYIAGGYSSESGFLNSVEMYDPVKKEWNDKTAEMGLKTKKSHGCAVYYHDRVLKNTYLYEIGGWNLNYLNEMHRMKVDESGNEWEALPGMSEGRSDMACAVTQYEWKIGIMVAGGYKLLGAWTTSIEFFEFETPTGKWKNPLFFPRLVQGRHNHGLTTIGLSPVVFGGWNNGAIRSAEKLDYCKNKWEYLKDFMLRPREKFAVMKAPKSFKDGCIKQD